MPLQKSDLQKYSSDQEFVQNPYEKPIHIVKTGNIFYAKLFVDLKKNQLYAGAVDEHTIHELGLITLRHIPDREILPGDKIRITKRHFYNAEGEFV